MHPSPQSVMATARFNRLLGGLGAAGQYRSNPLERYLELRGHRFEAEVIGTYSDGLFVAANQRVDVPEACTSYARTLAQRWPNPMLQQPMTRGGPELVDQLRDAAVVHGVAATTTLVPSPEGTGLQVFAIAPTVELPPATLGDLYRGLQMLPEELSREAVVDLVSAAGLRADDHEDRIVVAHDDEAVELGFDAQGVLVSTEIRLSEQTLFDMPIGDDGWQLISELIPAVFTIGIFPAGRLLVAHSEVYDAFQQDAFERGSMLLRMLLYRSNQCIEAYLDGQAAHQPQNGIPRALALLGQHFAEHEVGYLRQALLYFAARLLEANEDPDPEQQRGAEALLEALLA